MREEDLWIIDCEPRAVQMEAMRRSFLGYKLHEHKDSVNALRTSIRNGPAKGWGHLLEQRLGKTPATLNEWQLFKRHHDVNFALVFAPNKFKFDWVLEAEKFIPGVEAFAHDRKHKDTERFIANCRSGLLSINYEALRTERIRKLLIDWCTNNKVMVIADESIYIKGNKSSISKGARAIADVGDVTRILSGKPIVQGPHDMWAQLRFCGAISGKNYYSFRNRFCEVGGFQGKQVIGARNEEELNGLIDRWSMRARKVDWLETPGVDYSEETLKLTPEQEKIYHKLQSDLYVELEEGEVTADMVITKLMKLQQISSGFIIDDDRVPRPLVDPKKNPKLVWLKEKLQNEVSDKSIIVVNYNYSMDLLIDELQEFNPVYIRGGQDDVIEQKQRFNEDPNCRVIICQVKAAKYGNTLMGNPQDPCHTMIMYENSYSLDDRSQIEERPQGAGQQKAINIIDLVITKEDRKPLDALRRKEDVASVLLGYDRETGVLPRSRSRNRDDT